MFEYEKGLTEKLLSALKNCGREIKKSRMIDLQSEVVLLYFVIGAPSGNLTPAFASRHNRE